MWMLRTTTSGIVPAAPFLAWLAFVVVATGVAVAVGLAGQVSGAFAAASCADVVRVDRGGCELWKWVVGADGGCIL